MFSGGRVGGRKKDLGGRKWGTKTLSAALGGDDFFKRIFKMHPVTKRERGDQPVLEKRGI